MVLVSFDWVWICPVKQCLCCFLCCMRWFASCIIVDCCMKLVADVTLLHIHVILQAMDHVGWSGTFPQKFIRPNPRPSSSSQKETIRHKNPEEPRPPGDWYPGKVSRSLQGGASTFWSCFLPNIRLRPTWCHFYMKYCVLWRVRGNVRQNKTIISRDYLLWEFQEFSKVFNLSRHLWGTKKVIKVIQVEEQVIQDEEQPSQETLLTS